MNKTLAVLILISLVCLSGCAGSRVERVGQPLAIRVAGVAGASFMGTIKTNGVTQKVTGTVPTELHIDANASQLAGSFQQGAEPGTIRFEIFEGERLVGSAGTTGPGGHCRFTVREGGMGSRSSWRFSKE